MRTIYLRNPNNRNRSRLSKKKGQKFKKTALFFVVTLLAYLSLSIFRFFMPLSAIEGQVVPFEFPTSEMLITPPPSAQSAIGVAGQGVLKTYGDNVPRPIASVSKVVTALVILDKKPLKVGEQGDQITLTQADVDNYNEYVAKLGSVVPVEVGEQISQYQALQALLLPSSNNMADTLAVWAYGSLDDYVVAANNYAQSKGLNNTTLADASGFSPKTVSTAEDLIKIADIAMSNKVISEIVAQKEATIPVAGAIKNVNFLLGKDGIDGIKTGNTDEAGYCLLASATIPLEDGKIIRVYSVVLGSESRPLSMSGAHDLINKLINQYVTETIKRGTVFGKYSLPWGGTVDAMLPEDIKITHLKSEKLNFKINLDPISPPIKSGQAIGDLALTQGNNNQISTKLIFDKSVPGPALQWRLKKSLGF